MATKKADTESAPEADKRNLWERIQAVQQEVDYIQTEDKKINGQYRAVSYNAVIAHLRPSLLRHGLVLVSEMANVQRTPMESPGRDNRPGSPGWHHQVDVRIRIYCPATEEDFTGLFAGEGWDGMDKGLSKAFTSGVKNGLLKLFNIEVGDDTESRFGADAPDAGKVALITPEQCKELVELLTKGRLEHNKFCEAFGITLPPNLPAHRFDEAKAALMDRIAKQEEKAKAAAAQPAAPVAGASPAEIGFREGYKTAEELRQAPISFDAPAPAKNTTGRLDAAQMSELATLAQQAGVTPEMVAAKVGVKSLDEIEAGRFLEVKNALCLRINALSQKAA